MFLCTNDIEHLCFLIINCIPLSFLHVDGGYIPTRNILVYEPGQSAVIGWNGYMESFVLSTNLYTDSGANDWVIELIPFPSLPETPCTVSLDIIVAAGDIIDFRIGNRCPHFPVQVRINRGFVMG